MGKKMIERVAVSQMRGKGEAPGTRTEQQVPSLVLIENAVFEGTNDEYEILARDFLGKGGEGNVFKAKRKSDGALVAAKIYNEYTDTQKNREKRKNMLRFLYENTDYKRTHIMPLLDAGKIMVLCTEGDDPFCYPIDIMPLCENGSVEKADYKTLRDKIIPDVAKALHTIHSAGFIHRDVKPGNLFLYNGEIVLSDFGISCEIDDEEQEVYISRTGRQKGTLGYTAPEVMKKYAVPASDYYSLGCTIATLYKGEHVWQEKISAKEEGELYHLMRLHGLPLGCDEKEESLQKLVDVLIFEDEGKRPGYEAIQVWLRDTNQFEKKVYDKIGMALNGADNREVFQYSFLDGIYNSRKELTVAMAKNWDEAKKHLYRGSIFQTLNVCNQQELGNQIMDVTENIAPEKEGATLQHDVGLAKALYLLAGGGAIYWRGKEYGSLADISEAIKKSESDQLNRDILDLLAGGYLSWRMERMNGTPVKMKDTIRLVEKLCATPSNEELGYFFVLFHFGRQEILNNSPATADALFDIVFDNLVGLFENAELITKDSRIYGLLMHFGFVDAAIHTWENRTGKEAEDVKRLYMLFEGVCAKKKKVRKHYYKYGPEAHLYWFQENIELFLFSKEKLSLKEKIKSIPISERQSISEMDVSFRNLKVQKGELLKYFRNNILLASWGLDDGNTGIASVHSDAYFLENYYGDKAQSGFMRYMKGAGKH